MVHWWCIGGALVGECIRVGCIGELDELLLMSMF